MRQRLSGLAGNTNLRTIPHMRELRLRGRASDHTMGMGAARGVALGATVIEKHFTLSRADGGVDSAFSLEPAELRTLVEESERAWMSLGGVYLRTHRGRDQFTDIPPLAVCCRRHEVRREIREKRCE